MKRIIFSLLILLLTATESNSQKSDSQIIESRDNAVFLELAGSAIWYSVNYERKIPLASFHRITGGGGIMVMPPTKNANVMGLVSANYLFGKRHNLETGFSAGYLFFPSSEKDYVLSCRLGYRYESDRGFQFRGGLLPMIGPFAGVPEISPSAGSGAKSTSNTSTFYMPWAYISFGFSF